MYDDIRAELCFFVYSMYDIRSYEVRHHSILFVHLQIHYIFETSNIIGFCCYALAAIYIFVQVYAYMYMLASPRFYFFLFFFVVIMMYDVSFLVCFVFLWKTSR